MWGVGLDALYVSVIHTCMLNIVVMCDAVNIKLLYTRVHGIKIEAGPKIMPTRDRDHDAEECLSILNK